MDGATVYSLDLPGHARSPGDGCRTVDCYAEAVVAFLDALGVDQMIIVGHSMGGAIGQTLALQAMERVPALVLVGTGARLRVASAILEGIKDDFEEAIDLITRYAWSSDTDPSLMELGRDALLQTGPDVLLGDFVACDRFDIMDRLADIKVPALVIVGSLDRLTPLKYARYLAEHIPDARLVTVGGAGHMVMLEQPEQVAEPIREFVMASSSGPPKCGSLSELERAR
jgi:pimeloyl-ACP methyl ester carboxylesterase